MVDITVLGIAVISFIVSLTALSVSLSRFSYQLYQDFHKLYTTDKMDNAIREVWVFTRFEICKNKKILMNKLGTKEISKWLANKENKDILKKEYLKMANKTVKKEQEKFEILRQSRRIVTQYYLHLTSAYGKTKFFSKKVFFDWYSPKDLVILDILIILEEAESKRLGVDIEETRLKLRHFDKFKDDCKYYYGRLNTIDC